MQWQLSPSVILEAGTALAVLIVAACFPWNNLSRRASLIGSILLIIAALWILAHSLEIGLPVASYKAYLMGMQLIWGLLAMSLWLMYIIQYSASGRWQAGHIYALLGIMPLLAILATATNHLYGLMWTAPGLNIKDPYLPLNPAYGLFYWVCLAYLGALVACGGILVFRQVFRRHDFHRWEHWVLTLSAAIPMIAAILEVTGITQPAHLTIGMTPFFSCFGIIALVWVLPRFSLPKIIPVARNALFERIDNGVVVLDMQDRIVDLNPVAERLAGRACSEALGLPVEQLWPDWPSQSVSGELVLTRAGEPRTHNLHLYTITDQENRPVNKIGLLIDVTERQRAEERAKTFSNAIDSSYDCFVLVDMNGNVTYANRSAIKTFGYSSEEIMKLNLAQFATNPEMAEKIVKELKVKGDWAGESIAIKKNKETFPIMLTVSILLDNNGHPTGMMGVFHDITKSKQAEMAMKNKIDELELFYKAAGNREDRILELKKKIRELEQK